MKRSLLPSYVGVTSGLFAVIVVAAFGGPPPPPGPQPRPPAPIQPSPVQPPPPTNQPPPSNPPPTNQPPPSNPPPTNQPPPSNPPPPNQPPPSNPPPPNQPPPSNPPPTTLPPVQPPVTPATNPLQPFADDAGTFQTVSTQGTLDSKNPFFQSLGTNGRACVTCHQPSDGWSVRPDHLMQRFQATAGLDPIFRVNDGSNSPLAPVGTLADRQQAYSMLLTHGTIRVGLPIPANAGFTLSVVDDPYHYASAKELSLFRRPLPATNLPFVTSVMWDGRESPAGRSFFDSLASQATDAVLGHAQGTAAPTALQLQQIVALETHLYTAQISDASAGSLTDFGALGGPVNLSTQLFYPGINDSLGGDPNGIPFHQNAMALYRPWANLAIPNPNRASVARGEQIFNNKPIQITGVAGLNDLVRQPIVMGTCTTCHDTPNVGSHSVPMFLNIGISDANRRTPEMPLYTLRNTATGATMQTMDPGLALITGKWNDIGKVKVPGLRGLESRSPYFQNGSANSLDQVIQFYQQRFRIPFTPQERVDLAAFLRTL